MKDLNRYIKESLLDDEDDLVDNDDSIISKILNDPDSAFRKAVWFKGIPKNIKYHDGVLDIDAHEMTFNNIFERNDYKLNDFCPGIKTLKCKGNIYFNMRKITAENLCENIEARSAQPPTLHHYVEEVEGINFNCYDYKLGAHVIKDCNIKAKYVYFDRDISKFENVKIDCESFKYYDTFLTEEGLFADAFNDMLDSNYSFIIHDTKKGENVEFKPNKLKKIAAKAKNIKRYRSLDMTPLLKNPDLYKFKKGKTYKTLLKTMGLGNLNSNHIEFCNNNFCFILSDDPKQPRPFRLFMR